MESAAHLCAQAKACDYNHSLRATGCGYGFSPGDRSTQVTISDDAGVTQLILRVQRNTITEAMVANLDVIGDDPFNLSGIVVQDDTDDNGTLLDGFEIWERGADDVGAAS